MGWGWKTIVGGILLAAGQALKEVPEPILQIVGTILMGIGAILAPVGIADKFRRMPAK